jgi:hypothetical protein
MHRPLAIIAAALCVAAPLRAEKLQKWVYIQTNLLPDDTAAQVEQLIVRAGKAGYDHALIADSKFNRLGEMGEKYFKHVAHLREVAAGAQVEIVPAVFSMGYSNDLLSRNPNLAEGLPVKEAPFVVIHGDAQAVTEAPAQLLNGGFASSDKRNGWKVLDDCVKLEDGVLHMKEPQGGNARAMQALTLRPFRCYHLSVRLKSRNFGGQAEVKLLAGGQQLNPAYLHAKKTQDWTEHHVVFNSLDHTEVGLYLGAWGARGGELWWDDVKLEESGLVNLLRRDGCPLTVKTEDGKSLVEGTDFEPIQDSNMGVHPWAGGYDLWHAPPAIKTKLPDGTRLRVSFYHPVTVYDEQVCACPSEPQTMDLMRDQAKRMTALWQPRGFMMSHDEWRVMNWCDACMKRDLDAGPMVAQNARDCTGILSAANPHGSIYVWNDMFDPAHNARNHYYLVRGDLTGSWEGLDKKVVIMNWNLGKLHESLQFFAGRGHRQVIAGYYDAKVERLRDHLAAAKDVPGVIGVMYTTWKHNYSDLEAFAQIVDTFTATP